MWNLNDLLCHYYSEYCYNLLGPGTYVPAVNQIILQPECSKPKFPGPGTAFRLTLTPVHQHCKNSILCKITDSPSFSTFGFTVNSFWTVTNTGRVNLLSDAWARRYDLAISCSKMSIFRRFTAANSWIISFCWRIMEFKLMCPLSCAIQTFLLFCSHL